MFRALIINVGGDTDTVTPWEVQQNIGRCAMAFVAIIEALGVKVGRWLLLIASISSNSFRIFVFCVCAAMHFPTLFVAAKALKPILKTPASNCIVTLMGVTCGELVLWWFQWQIRA